MLQNTFYIGYKDYEVKGLKGKSKEYCREKGLIHKHRFECVSIIEKEEFEYVQKLISQRKQKSNSNSNKHKFLLKEMLLCGGCGNIMRGKHQPSMNVNIYRCVTNESNWRDNRISKCDNSKSVNRVGIEEILWINVLNIFKNSELLKEEFRKENLPQKIR